MPDRPAAVRIDVDMPANRRQQRQGRRRTTKQTAGCHSTNGWRSAKVALAVHPRFGEEVAVVSAHGRNAVQVETFDEQLMFLPLAWTTLRPRAEPLTVSGCAVRLDPDALRELATWVAARVVEEEAHHGRDGQEVGHFNNDMENRGPDGGHSDEPADPQEGSGRADAREGGCSSPAGDSAAAVVGQAGSPSAHRGQRERGTR